MILTRENNSQHFTTCFYVPRMQKNEKLSNAKQLIGKNILNSIEPKLQESLTAIGKNSNPLELNDQTDVLIFFMLIRFKVLICQHQMVSMTVLLDLIRFFERNLSRKNIMKKKLGSDGCHLVQRISI